MRRALRPAARVYYRWQKRRPVRFGHLRRTTPIDEHWGYSRGAPIDRFYIDDFVGRHGGDIRGRVLEIASARYTKRFGTGVDRIDVLMAGEGNPNATIVGDLTNAPHIPSDTFDCAIVTQTLQFIYDVPAALRTLRRILAPEGVLLVTVPCLTRISLDEDDIWGQWWHFTSRSLNRLGREVFGEENVEVRTYGNVLSATGFLYGLASSDLRREELEIVDPAYPVTVGLRAVKRD